MTTASGGVATFGGCAINLAGVGYTLRATDGALTSATSIPITISVGPAASLAFSTQPGGGTDGAVWGTQPVIALVDAGGNPVVTATNEISLTIASQPGSGAQLNCAVNSVDATAGVASFSGCSVLGKAGSYTLGQRGRSHQRHRARRSPSRRAQRPSWDSPPNRAGAPTAARGAPSRW